jgi:membrane protein implicated in regulation of membrane protease activity
VAVATPLVVVTTVTTAILMGLLTLAAIRTRRMPAPAGTVGVQVPLGTLGSVQAPLDPVGTAYLAGESWTARTADDAPVARDTPVRLVGFDGLTAIVEPLTDQPAPAAAGPPSGDSR